MQLQPYATINKIGFSMNMPEIEYIGWDDGAAVDLVGAQLLALAESENSAEADAFRHAIVVVPTAESGRRLRERVAELAYEKAGKFKPVLMPEIELIGQLTPEPGAGVAGESDTLAAWLEVLGAEGKEALQEYAPLIPLCPETHVERWRVGVAFKLMKLRTRLEQYEIAVNRVTGLLQKREDALGNPSGKSSSALQTAYRKERLRWSKLGELFARVDKNLEGKNLKPSEKYRAEFAKNPVWPTNKRMVIVACQPEILPQVQTLLRNLHGRDGGQVRIWVNAPKSEAAAFDEFGQPRKEVWCEREIDIPNAFVYSDKECKVVDDAASCIHVVDDAAATADKMLQLAGGHPSNDVVLAVGDSQYTAPVITAFENPPQGEGWKLNMPEGRSLMGTEVARLVEQLADLCAARADFRIGDDEGGMVELNAFTALLCNRVTPGLVNAGGYAPASLQRDVEKLRAERLPGTVTAFCDLLAMTVGELRKKAAEEKDGEAAMGILRNAELWEKYSKYATATREFVDACCDLSRLPGKLREMADGLMQQYEGSPLQKPVDKLCETMLSLCGGTLAADAGNAVTLWEVLRYKVRQSASGVQDPAARMECVGDVLGWREVPYAHGSRLILGAIHDGCVPEPVAEDEFLPQSLCRELGIDFDAFRTARDAFLLTALLRSRKAGQVHIIVARQNPDGSGAAPSPLLLHCGKALPQRARTFFAESTSVGPLPKVPRCPIRKAAPGPEAEAEDGMIHPGMMEDIHQLAPDADKPYLTWRQRMRGGKARPLSFSPSRLSGFLQCPLSFWLTNLFGLDACNVYDDDKADLESSEFGTLVHSVLERVVEQFPNLETLKAAYPDADTPEQQAARLLDVARAVAAEEWEKTYPPSKTLHLYTLPMQVQLLTMEQMLQDFAARHAQDLNEGWCNVAREFNFTPELVLSSGTTVTFNMKADRIDRNRDGRWRIIDYKTSNQEKKPFDVHLAELDGGADSYYSRFMNTKDYPFSPVKVAIPRQESNVTKLYRWKDVQLMLYMFGLRETNAHAINGDLPPESLKDVVPDLLYYNLQTKEKTLRCYPLLQNGKLMGTPGGGTFEDTPLQLMENAMANVKSVIRMILDGKCLFSAESLRLEDRPFTRLVDEIFKKKNAPRFGALSPRRDPRSMFCLPELKK